VIGVTERLFQDCRDFHAFRVTNQPLVRLQDLVKAYNILVNRMDEAARIETQMAVAARDNIAQLDKMTAELEKRAKAEEISREAVSSISG